MKLVKKHMLSDRRRYINMNEFANNQYELHINDIIVFQSYNTLIAIKLYSKTSDDFEYIIDKDALNHSRTTNKYLYEFFNMQKKEILNQIKCGKIIIAPIIETFNKFTNILEK